jgi:hypothetical protein
VSLHDFLFVWFFAQRMNPVAANEGSQSVPKVMLFKGDDHRKKGKNMCIGQCRLSNRQSNGNGLVGFLLKNGD